jgi:hypothetical protein
MNYSRPRKQIARPKENIMSDECKTAEKQSRIARFAVHMSEAREASEEVRKAALSKANEIMGEEPPPEAKPSCAPSRAGVLGHYEDELDAITANLNSINAALLRLGE